MLPVDEWNARVESGYIRLEENQAEIDAWWGSLSPADQLKPANIAKYETANRAMDLAGKLLNGIYGAVYTAETSTVDYSREKNLKDKWNFIIGSQFQLNKHIMVRTEYGFLASRT